MEDSPRTLNKLLKNCIIVYIGEQNIGTAVVCLLKAVLKIPVQSQDIYSVTTDCFKKSSNIHIMKRKERRKKDRLGCGLINR
jgi:hypothetical protein